MQWLERMADAVDFIETKLTDRVDVDELARRAYCSPFHFQRMFHVWVGVTVAEYVRRRRLTLASAKVLDVALKYQYESPEEFAKALRRIQGISPSEARQRGVNLKAYSRVAFYRSQKGDKDVDYQIIPRNAFAVTEKCINVSHQDNEKFLSIPAF